MKIFKLSALALIISAIGFYSCKKEAYTVVTSDALIHFSGSVGADGCGFLMDIELNGNTYSPTNLPAEYTTRDSSKVRVTYKLTDGILQCGAIGGGGFKQIEIQQIDKL